MVIPRFVLRLLFVAAVFLVSSASSIGSARAQSDVPPAAAVPAEAAPSEAPTTSTPAEPVPAAPVAPPPNTSTPALVTPAPTVRLTPPSPTISSKFAATFYGFVEFDSIYDSTQSFNDLAGNGGIARSGSFAGDYGRLIFGARNSRLGFKLKGPETSTIKSSAIAEMDFLGNQPQGSPAPAGSPAVSEGSFITSPTFRMRHLALKVETPVIDVLAGQYWELFGWQSMFHPNTVEIQGVPGQIYSRAPQLRISHLFKNDDISVEIAIAASRPPQRDSATPDGQGGLRFALNNWKGVHTAGAAGTSLDPLSIGVSGVGRHFRLPEFSATPTNSVSITSWGVSIDGLIPVLPATTINDGNALTLTGSYVYGQSIADLYTGLTGGTSFPALPANAMGTVPAYPQDIDNGLAVYTSDGTLHAIRWQSFIFGAQYYLPTPIRMFVSANYSHMSSPNIDVLATASNKSKMFDKSDWADGNFFVDATGSIRFGLEYAWFRQTYLDGVKATNNRVQFSAFYIF
jgi:hypothetical protein